MHHMSEDLGLSYCMARNLVKILFENLFQDLCPGTSFVDLPGFNPEDNAKSPLARDSNSS